MVENKDQDQRIHELVKEVAVLRSDMNTKQAQTETAIERMNAAFERLRTDMAKRDVDMAGWKADMADWKTDMARRDKANMQWIAGFVLGSAVLVIAVLGLILTSTPAP